MLGGDNIYRRYLTPNNVAQANTKNLLKPDKDVQFEGANYCTNCPFCTCFQLYIPHSTMTANK